MTMPWKTGTYEAACAGLRSAAINAQMMPYEWNGAIETNKKDGGTAIYGCGWGQVAWIVAVYLGGTSYARQMLPVDADQSQVDLVLQAAGLTEAEIEQMDPQAVWEHFDHQLQFDYVNRKEYPWEFIETSVRLAEMFVQVLEQVPRQILEPEVVKMPEHESVWSFSAMFANWSPVVSKPVRQFEPA